MGEICVAPNGVGPNNIQCCPTIASAVASLTSGTINIYDGTYAETGLVVPPKIGLRPAPGAHPIITGSPNTVTMTFDTRSDSGNGVTIGALDIRSGNPGTALLIRQHHNPSINIVGTIVRAIGPGSVGLEVTDNNVQGVGDGMYTFDLQAFTDQGSCTGTSCTTAFRMNSNNEFECTRCIFNAQGGGVAYDLLKGPSCVSTMRKGEIHVGPTAIGLRRGEAFVQMLDTAFVADAPQATGGTTCGVDRWCFIQETTTNTAGLSLDVRGIHEDTCRNQFVVPPRVDGTHWRGACSPFPCTDTTAAGEIVGTHWFQTTDGKDYVCTTSGWRPLKLQ